jgi:hypothetical protein
MVRRAALLAERRSLVLHLGFGVGRSALRSGSRVASCVSGAGASFLGSSSSVTGSFRSVDGSVLRHVSSFGGNTGEVVGGGACGRVGGVLRLLRASSHREEAEAGNSGENDLAHLEVPLVYYRDGKP